MGAQGENRRAAHYYMDVIGNTAWGQRAAAMVRMGLALVALAICSVLGTRHSALGREPRTEGRVQTAQPKRVPILEYHLVREKASGQFIVSRDEFRRDLHLLYDRGYRPITVAQLVDKDFSDVPDGMSPVVFTFDDASPEQFSYIEHDGSFEIDSLSVIGMWLEFQRTHPDWKSRATFCLLSGAEAGHSFFGDSAKWNGQHAAWRFKKLRWLAENGFELCNHTLWHAQLNKFSDEIVQEQIARGQLAIDSAVPGYKVRTFALPQGLWPVNRELAWRGSWTNPKTGHITSYDYGTVMTVSGGPVPSPFDTSFDARRLTRFMVFEGNLKSLLDRLDSTSIRFRVNVR